MGLVIGESSKKLGGEGTRRLKTAVPFTMHFVSPFCLVRGRRRGEARTPPFHGYAVFAGWEAGTPYFAGWEVGAPYFAGWEVGAQY